jgi:hypothetical protein
VVAVAVNPQGVPPTERRKVVSVEQRPLVEHFFAIGDFRVRIGAKHGHSAVHSCRRPIVFAMNVNGLRSIFGSAQC